MQEKTTQNASLVLEFPACDKLARKIACNETPQAILLSVPISRHTRRPTRPLASGNRYGLIRRNKRRNVLRMFWHPWLRIERLTRLAVAARLREPNEEADHALAAVLTQRRRV